MSTLFQSRRSAVPLRIEPKPTPHPSRPIARPPAVVDTVDLGALLATLWRGKAAILLAACAGLVLAGYYAYVMATPLYRSTAVIMLNSREEQVVDLNSVIGGLSAETSVVNSEVEVLRSRALLGMVVDVLTLQDDVEFNPFLRDTTLLDRAKSTVRGALSLPDRRPDLTEQDRAERSRQATIDGLLARMTIRNVPQSLVFQVMVETTDPRKSTRIADTVTALYIRNQLELKLAATDQAIVLLTERVAQSQAQLLDIEGQIKAFRGTMDVIDNAMLAAQERQLKDLREREAQTETALDEARARLAVLQSIGGDQTPPTAIRREIDRTSAQLATLRASSVPLEAQIDRQSTDLVTFQQLNRDAEAIRALYEFLLARLKETTAQQGIQQADSRVLSAAVVPVSPASPQKLLILLLGGGVGCGIGAIWVVIREMRSSSFRNARTLEHETGYPVMGQVPLVPFRARRDPVAYLAENPTSVTAESIRNLRTSLLMASRGDPPQVILISSAVPGEGKTTLTLALAQNLAGVGNRVLLVEGDIRRRALSRYVHETQTGTLNAVLSGEASLADAVQCLNGIGVDVLVGRKSAVNAADLFSAPRFAEMIAQARNRYDVILIDTPPVLVVPDARILTQHADAVLFAVNWDKTPRDQVQDALGMFETVDSPVIGLVLNQINPRGMRKYGYGGAYGGYVAQASAYYGS